MVYSSINMTEWMFFCKKLEIVDRIKKLRKDGVKWLSYIFKRKENAQRRMNYDSFVEGVREIIIELVDRENNLNE